MKFFPNSKQPPAAPALTIPLGGVCEGSLLLLCTALWPQNDGAAEPLRVVCVPVVEGIKAELARRQRNRGAPIAIELPERLPALSIAVAGYLFGRMVETMRQCESDARSTVGTPASTVQQFCDAREVSEALLAALEECRVAL